MHRVVPLSFHPSAIRHIGLSGKVAEPQRLSAGCRVRRQASVGAALLTWLKRTQNDSLLRQAHWNALKNLLLTSC